jgi:hypothetical protein
MSNHDLSHEMATAAEIGAKYLRSRELFNHSREIYSNLEKIGVTDATLKAAWSAVENTRIQLKEWAAAFEEAAANIVALSAK